MLDPQAGLALAPYSAEETANMKAKAYYGKGGQMQRVRAILCLQARKMAQVTGRLAKPIGGALGRRSGEGGRSC